VQNFTQSEGALQDNAGLQPQPSELLKSLLKANGLMNNEEAAAYLGVTPRTLEVWRCVKRYNIAYIKVGRLVRYKQAALDSFIESRTVDA
jgi:excisionase family DNA binding protein